MPMADGWSGDDEAGADAAVLPLASVPTAFLDFTAFYRRELPALVTLAAAIAGTDRAEEVAQEALLRAHRDWRRIERYDKPGAWVRRVTINLAASTRRRRATEARALARLAHRRQVDAPPPETDGFWSLVRQLPDRQAAAVALHYLEDLSIAEMALVLDCAPGTAKAHLHKARQALAALINDQEPER
jgi:RNA polymerase sigma-70 factor (ECF subfamily)